MSRFLIALQEGGGDSPPFVFIARGLVAAGHEVTALADPVLRPDVEAAGAVFRSWRAAPHKETYSPDENLARDWEARTPLGKFKRFRDGIAFGPSSGYARDVLEESQRLRPDVVLATTVGFGAQAGAEAAGVPLVVAMTTCYLVPGTGAAPYASGLGPPRSAPQRFRQALLDPVAQRLWATGLPPLNAARREIGLDPVTTPFEQLHRAARFLVLTSPPFDFPVPRLPDNVRYVGPRLDAPDWAGAWAPPSGKEPLVVVGLSSTYMEQEGLLQRIADALGELPVRGLITLGPAVSEPGLRVPPT